MRAWLNKRKRTTLMNRVLRSIIGMVTHDTSMEVARFSYIDAEHVEVMWKIYDYFEGENGYHKAECVDAHVEFVATLDEAATMLAHGHLGPFAESVDGYYTMAGHGQVPLNILEPVQNQITNRTCRLIVEAGGRGVSVMTVIPRSNPGHAMSLLRMQAEGLYRANLARQDALA